MHKHNQIIIIISNFNTKNNIQEKSKGIQILTEARSTAVNIVNSRELGYFIRHTKQNTMLTKNLCFSQHHLCLCMHAKVTGMVSEHAQLLWISGPLSRDSIMKQMWHTCITHYGHDQQYILHIINIIVCMCLLTMSSKTASYATGIHISVVPTEFL